MGGLAAALYAYQESGGRMYPTIALPAGNAGQKTYVIRIEDVKAIANPGLVILVDNTDASAKGSVDVNGNVYPFPQSPAGLLAKLVIPVKPEHLRNGLNRISYPGSSAKTYQVLDSRIQAVNETSAQVAGLSYLPRAAVPGLADFDLVTNDKGAGKRKESELVPWAKRGTVRYYRAGVDFNHVDRLIEMFKEARINLAMLQTVTPDNLQSPEYKRYKDFIDRCHAAGIKVMFDGGTGDVRLNAISIDSVLLHPQMRDWVSKDDLGFPLWRTPNRSFWPDLKNKDYRKEVLKAAEIAVDSGADAFYYDWAIGGTSDLLGFFNDVREMTIRKGKNIPIYGNCKGNIMVEERCDFTKSEGTEEAGVWDGKWVHNVAQARFYYAAGDGWKPYESKYEGADPGKPNPGAHDVRDEMKMGWKRPIAEAAAFQSFFAIAEAGRPLLQGWIQKDNAMAMTAWADICRYHNFLADHEDLYTDVKTVSNIGLIAPPVIPSFEMSLKRAPLYNALVELNFMYDVVLLSRLSEGSLAGYKAIVIPDVPWTDENQQHVIQRYKQGGGRVLTVGSSEELRKTASTVLPASLAEDIQKQPVRDEFKRELLKLAGDPLVAVQNARYVIANLVRKPGSDRVIAHFVNYGPAAESVNVRLNLAGVVKQINPKNMRLLSPDNVTKELKDVSVNGAAVTFTIPKIEIYDVVAIN
ncbi:MAG: hypothetical protein LAP39_30865 [Acidobacteriia bacterium]|nr:hypothetical protein [Terriglobia bacterium]